MIEIELGDLKKVSRDISVFLGQKLKREVTVKGDMLIVPETADSQRFGMKGVKMQVKHALYRLGLSDEYRVLSGHHRIRIVRVKEKLKPRVERKGSAPPPSQSLPYLFP